MKWLIERDAEAMDRVLKSFAAAGETPEVARIPGLDNCIVGVCVIEPGKASLLYDDISIVQNCQDRNENDDDARRDYIQTIQKYFGPGDTSHTLLCCWASMQGERAWRERYGGRKNAS